MPGRTPSICGRTSIVAVLECVSTPRLLTMNRSADHFPRESPPDLRDDCAGSSLLNGVLLATVSAENRPATSALGAGLSRLRANPSRRRVVVPAGPRQTCACAHGVSEPRAYIAHVYLRQSGCINGRRDNCAEMLMAQYYSRGKLGAWDLFVIAALMRSLVRRRVRLSGAPAHMTFTEGALMGPRVLVAFGHACSSRPSLLQISFSDNRASPVFPRHEIGDTVVIPFARR